MSDTPVPFATLEELEAAGKRMHNMLRLYETPTPFEVETLDRLLLTARESFRREPHVTEAEVNALLDMVDIPKPRTQKAIRNATLALADFLASRRPARGAVELFATDDDADLPTAEDVRGIMRADEAPSPDTFWSRTELKRRAVMDPNGSCPDCNTNWRFHEDGLCPSPHAPEHLRRPRPEPVTTPTEVAREAPRDA